MFQTYVVETQFTLPLMKKEMDLICFSNWGKMQLQALLDPGSQTSLWNACSVSWLSSVLAECPCGMVPISGWQLKESIFFPVDLWQSWSAGPGEVESILFELLGERRKGGSRREMGQTENSTEFIRKINLRILKIKQTTGVFSKTLSLSWVCYPSTHPSRHFYCHDTHLPVDTSGISDAVCSLLW